MIISNFPAKKVLNCNNCNNSGDYAYISISMVEAFVYFGNYEGIRTEARGLLTPSIVLSV